MLNGIVTLEAGKFQCVEVNMQFADFAAAEAFAAQMRAKSAAREGQPAPVTTAAPVTTPVPASTPPCQFCQTPTVKAAKTGPKSPDYKCPKCKAAAWAYPGGKLSWKQ